MKTVLVLLGLLISFNCFGTEERERDQVRRESGRLFQANDFEALERIATLYRDDASRTSSGTWKLRLFYDGIATIGLGFEKSEQDQWRQELGRFDEWQAQYPASPTPVIAKAAAIMGRGWAMRGTGPSKGVQQGHMSLYQELAAETGEYLANNDSIRSVDPHWYALMAYAYEALGVESDAFWELYAEGLETYPHYDPLIFVAGNYFSPQWYGSLEEVEKLARYTAVQTEATRDFAPYARLYWVAGYQRRINMYAFQTPYADWSDMVRGMDAVISRYPSQWNIQHFGFFACFQRDKSTLARYIGLVVEPVIEEAWVSEANFQNCRSMGLNLPPK